MARHYPAFFRALFFSKFEFLKSKNTVMLTVKRKKNPNREQQQQRPQQNGLDYSLANNVIPIANRPGVVAKVSEKKVITVSMVMGAGSQLTAVALDPWGAVIDELGLTNDAAFIPTAGPVSYDNLNDSLKSGRRFVVTNILVSRVAGTQEFPDFKFRSVDDNSCFKPDVLIMSSAGETPDRNVSSAVEYNLIHFNGGGALVDKNTAIYMVMEASTTFKLTMNIAEVVQLGINKQLLLDSVAQ